jgi:hypothetical protein
MKKCYTIALLCFISALTATSQTRYWVGPAVGIEGNWNNTTYWSTTSGGAGGASVPNGATFNVIFDEDASVNVDIAALTLNTITVTNSRNVLFYTGVSTDITVNSSSAVTPGLDIDAGSTLRDSATLNGVTFRMVFAANARGEIDGDFRLGSNPATNGSSVLTANTAGSIVNINSGGRVIFGSGGIAQTLLTSDPRNIFFNAGSFLIVDRNAGVVPIAEYNTTSTVRIIGNTTSATSLNGNPPVLGNFEYDSPNVTAATLTPFLTNGAIIKGNFRVLNTNNRKLVLVQSPVGAGTVGINVNGNFEVSGNSVVTIVNNTNRTINFDIDGNFVQSNGTISLQDNNAAAFPINFMVGENFTQTGGNFTVGSTATSASTNLFVLELNGSVNQNVSVSSVSIDNSSNQVALRMNNSAGATLLTPLSVGRMDFVAGRLTTAAASALTINNTSNAAFVINGVSDNSHVNGPVRRLTAAAALYAFPVGKGGNYRIIEVQPATAAASEYTAEYFNTAHPSSSVQMPLTGRSNAEYWTVNRNAGADAIIQLTLEGAVPNSNASMEIVVGRFTGAAWQSERGATGTSTFGNATSGSIYSRLQNTFGPYTFVFGPFGALPIKLTEFSAVKASGYNNIHWKADCTSTQAVFEIERSSDGQNFQKIETVVADRLRCQLPFDYQDRSPLAGTNYYRLRIVDVDQKSYYSRIVAVVNRTKGFELVGIYPTLITSGQLKVNITSAGRDKAELFISNVSGQVMKRMQVSVENGENIIYVDVASLAAGVYQITGINSEGQPKTLRFVKQ